MTPSLNFNLFSAKKLLIMSKKKIKNVVKYPKISLSIITLLISIRKNISKYKHIQCIGIIVVFADFQIYGGHLGRHLDFRKTYHEISLSPGKFWSFSHFSIRSLSIAQNILSKTVHYIISSKIFISLMQFL